MFVFFSSIQGDKGPKVCDLQHVTLTFFRLRRVCLRLSVENHDSQLKLTTVYRLDDYDIIYCDVKDVFFVLSRVVPASDTPAIKVNEGLRGLQGNLVLPDLQLRWFDLETALLCSRCLDPLDHRDHQGQMGLQGLQEPMESL